MTYDQGSEMSLHKTLTKTANIAVYFAHPHSPWERGSAKHQWTAPRLPAKGNRPLPVLAEALDAMHGN